MIEIRMLKKAELNGYTFIEGFPGIGLVGPMSIGYMIDKLKMEYCGYIHSDDFPPLISIHNSKPMPPVRLYYSQKNRIVAVFAEFAIPIELNYDMSERLIDFVKSNGIAKIISIVGVPIKSLGLGIDAKNAETEKSDKVYGIASTESQVKAIEKAGMVGVTEGVATGVSALLLERAVIENIDDLAILVSVDQGMIDPKYAELAVNKIDALLDLNIDTAELEKEARLVEAKVKELLKKNKETHDDYKNAVEAAGPSMYA